LARQLGKQTSTLQTAQDLSESAYCHISRQAMINVQRNSLILNLNSQAMHNTVRAQEEGQLQVRCR